MDKRVNSSSDVDLMQTRLQVFENVYREKKMMKYSALLKNDRNSRIFKTIRNFPYILEKINSFQ